MTTSATDSAGTASTESSTRKRSRSLTEILAIVDWRSLSPRAQETIRTLGVQLAADCSQLEISATTGISESVVASRIGDLRRELLDQAREHADELGDDLRARIEELGG